MAGTALAASVGGILSGSLAWFAKTDGKQAEAQLNIPCQTEKENPSEHIPCVGDNEILVNDPPVSSHGDKAKKVDL